MSIGCIALFDSYMCTKIYSIFLYWFRKVCGPHRTCPKSLCLTRVHLSTVSVHLRSREGLQLAGLPLIAWTVTVSAAVREKVNLGTLYCSGSYNCITYMCTVVIFIAATSCGLCRDMLNYTTVKSYIMIVQVYCVETVGMVMEWVCCWTSVSHVMMPQEYSLLC